MSLCHYYFVRLYWHSLQQAETKYPQHSSSFSETHRFFLHVNSTWFTFELCAYNYGCLYIFTCCYIDCITRVLKLAVVIGPILLPEKKGGKKRRHEPGIDPGPPDPQTLALTVQLPTHQTTPFFHIFIDITHYYRVVV